ncbi:uncharacterized protein LOC6533843 isoform X1 [Drosophila yakuba]|uniref:Uncharacterized protein n=2 Tax=Drosophila yakuba TaxID=7245 RepID=B4PG91_DROYA|nr:uncharacterized protein LOC6533843 isoform X1 [Drosophila yakuba]EDW94255.1 uncharacterized protein Dyak_GE21883 [Drosophila yakuba]
MDRPILNTCEMYPRRRTTEFYKSPEPRVSFQSQQAEHPAELLNVTPDENREAARRLPRIQPSNNLDSIYLRNGYFS